jgi:hypothetical protein
MIPVPTGKILEGVAIRILEGIPIQLGWYLDAISAPPAPLTRIKDPADC